MVKKRRHRERFSLKNAMGIGMQTTKTALYGQPLLHVNCAGALEIENCKGIVSYDSHQLRINMGEQEVLIEGDDIVVGTYQKKMITVRGHIFSIRFYYGGGTPR